MPRIKTSTVDSFYFLMCDDEEEDNEEFDDDADDDYRDDDFIEDTGSQITDAPPLDIL